MEPRIALLEVPVLSQRDELVSGHGNLLDVHICTARVSRRMDPFVKEVAAEVEPKDFTATKCDLLHRIVHPPRDSSRSGAFEELTVFAFQPEELGPVALAHGELLHVPGDLPR